MHDGREQVSLPVRIERGPAKAFVPAQPAPAPPPIPHNAPEKPPLPCDGTVRHKGDAVTEAQEMKQGWEHMPCGVHAAPWRIELVQKSVVADKMTPCQFATNGRPMPHIVDLVRLSIAAGVL